MISKKLMRAEEFAEYLNVKVSTVRRMILLRQVPTVKIGRSVRIPIEAAEHLVEAGYLEVVAK